MAMKPSCNSSKPVLVVDLDHTLLHSTLLFDVVPEDAARLQFVLTCTSPRLPRGLHLHGHGDAARLTKLRPFARQFLRAASSMFLLYGYTMATPAHAAATAHILDPSGCLFQGRVISRPAASVKSLTNFPHPLSAVIIVDYTPRVWQANHQASLVAIDRYSFFSSSTSPALLAARQDESEPDGALARTLGLLFALHTDWQSQQRDIRKILWQVRARTLAGCKLAFPASITPPADSLWHLALCLGATCSRTVDESVTHVVVPAGKQMALPHVNVHVVRPLWIVAAFYTWMRPSEKLYSADAAVVLSFSETTYFFVECISTMHAHDDHHDVHESAAPLIDILAAVAAPSASTTTPSCSHHQHVLPGQGRSHHGAPSATPA